MAYDILAKVPLDRGYRAHKLEIFAKVTGTTVRVYPNKDCIWLIQLVGIQLNEASGTWAENLDLVEGHGNTPGASHNIVHNLISKTALPKDWQQYHYEICGSSGASGRLDPIFLDNQNELVFTFSPALSAGETHIIVLGIELVPLM